jgi:hypothetical protein
MTKKRTHPPEKPAGDREDVRFAAALQQATARQREALRKRRGTTSAGAAEPQRPDPDARCST